MAAKSRPSKPIPLFGVHAAVILGGELQLPHSTEEYRFTAREEENTQGPSQLPSSSSPSLPSSELHCLSCQTSFPSREEQVTHYRLDWHRYNLKRRLKGQAAVSQEEFERVSGDLSSISGSESSSESDSERERKEDEKEEERRGGLQLGGSPFVHFTAGDGTLYAVYRSIVTCSKTSPSGSSLVDGLRALRQQDQTWIILMKAGGHFAGAVFRDSILLAHKTFHRYTVRAKRGTAQSVRDAQHGGQQPRSAGASLRRYNETALEHEIQTLISSWSQHVQLASAVFIRTPKYSRSIFVGGKRSPFLREDPRLRTIPFPTRRPTLREVKDVHNKLAAIYLRPSDPSGVVGSRRSRGGNVGTKEESKDGSEKVEEEEGCGDASSEEDKEQQVKVGRKRRKQKAKEKSGTTTEAVAEGLPTEAQELLSVCREGTVASLTDLLARMNLRPVHTDTPQRRGGGEGEGEGGTFQLPEVLNQLYGGRTVLHVAAESGQAELVQLLMQFGANPSIRNSSGHAPYILAKDKPVRDAFRRFMAQFPCAYDYQSSQIPSPLTEDMEKDRREKMAERKRTQKKAKKLREKERRGEEELKSSERSRETAVASLTDRERRAMAAERRMARQLPSATTVRGAGACEVCSQSLAGVLPFERLTYKYCSMACVKEHRIQLARK